MSYSEYSTHTLPNGIRIVHRNGVPTEIVHIGIVVGVGSSDENATNNGISHFIEHCVFKATKSRNAYQILSGLEKYGGDINAYTTREKTCYYASCLSRYAGKAMELLSDIVFNSTFPAKETEREKKVVIEEIEMYEDSPDDSIYDVYYAKIFGKHPLGFSILGKEKNVNAFNSQMLHEYKKKHYTTDKIILSATGDISFEALVKFAEKYLGEVPASSGKNNRKKPEYAKSFSEEIKKDFTQTHCILGSPAYSRTDEKRYAASLLNNILGNGGMSSKLNMAVREKHGLTYNISSYFSSYTDAGIFSVYFGTDGSKLDKCLQLVYKELRQLRDKKLSPQTVKQAKIQYHGQMAMLNENQSSHMQAQALSLLDFGRIFTLPEYLEKIYAVTENQIQDIANELFDERRISKIIFREKVK